jgi:hypothetical protein
MSSQIPTLDIRRFTQPTSSEDRQAFIDELGAAYREWGFAGIRNHGIPQAQIEWLEVDLAKTSLQTIALAHHPLDEQEFDDAIASNLNSLLYTEATLL